MDVAEIKKLDSYLKRLFGSPRIRVVPRPQRDDYAEVFLGDEPFGRIMVDDEDEERSYNFEKAITLSGAAALPQARQRDGGEAQCLSEDSSSARSSRCASARPRPTAPTCTSATSSSACVFADEGGFALEMAILEQDLES